MATRKDNKGRSLHTGEQQRKSDGIYLFRYTDISNKRQTIYARDLPQLRVKEKQIQKDLDDNIHTDSYLKNMTLNEMFEQYMDTKVLADSTKMNYRNIWNRHVKDDLGNSKITCLRSSHIKSFYAKLSQKGYSHSTIKLIHALIFPTLELAVDDDIIRKNPAKDAFNSNYGEEAKDKIILTLEQQKKLIDFMKKKTAYQIYTPMILIFLKLGLRCGELIGLTWDDIDFNSKIVSINHQLIYKNYGDGCGFHVESPKTAAGIRNIPMTETIEEILKEQQKLNLMLGRYCKDDIEGYDNFVFISKNNRPYMPAGINSILYNIVNAYNKYEMIMAENDNRVAELIPQFSVHALRHTFCTNKARENMNVKTLQYLMGHSSSAITLDVYNHLDNQEDIRQEMLRCEQEYI